jgi:hypothetical protein
MPSVVIEEIPAENFVSFMLPLILVEAFFVL